MLEEIEAALADADRAASDAREQAFDLLASPDAAKARATMEDAAFTRDRLRTVLPRLQQRLKELQAEESWTQWRTDYEAQKVKRDTLAKEFRDIYQRAVAEIVDICTRIAANDAELSHLHQARPAGVSLHLRSAELKARNLEDFSRDVPSITKGLRLPDWDRPTKTAWPPPQTPLAVLATQGMPASPPHPGGNWWQDRDERVAAQRAEQERVAAFYRDQQCAKEEREKAGR